MSGTYINLPPDAGGGSGFIASVTSSNSITLTVLSNNLSADLKLSADPATAGSLKVTNTIHADGLHSEAPFATALATGFLTNTDWTTFNSKEPAITAGTTLQYWRGDKTFQTLDTGVVPENGNLYFTNARARSAISATTPVDYDNSTGVISMQAASTSTDGYLTSTDWDTFNDKEPAITPGTTGDYYRGDKTFQPLNLAALTPDTSGTPAASGTIGEILTATQATNTATGVGASGVYGNVISLSVPAGRWALFGTAAFVENGAVLTTGLQCGVSASASGAGLSEFDTALSPGLLSGTSDLIMPTPRVFVDLSATTTYYLNTKFSYTSGTPQHRGKITAERIG